MTVSRGVPSLLAVGALAIGTAVPRAQPGDSQSAMIVGQVVDGTSGRPVGQAAVTLNGPPSFPLEGMIGRPAVLTGSDGRFVFRGLPRGTYTILAQKGGYAAAASGRGRPGGIAQPLVLADGARVGDAVVRMWKYAAITGTVVDETGEPQVGVQLRAYRRAIQNGSPQFIQPVPARTDDRGVYRFGALLPGEYVVAATWPQVAATTALLVEMGSRGGTMGRSVRAGDTWYPLDRGNPTPPPPQDGRLFVYTTTFHPAGESVEQAMVIAVSSGQERTAVDIQLRPVATARVSGVVVGPPMLGAPVLQLRPADADAVVLDEDAPSVAASRSGAFTFPAVPEGAYTLRVIGIEAFGDQGAGRNPPALWANVPLTVGREDIDGLAIVMQPALTVSGWAEFDGNGPRPSAAQLRQVPIVVERADTQLVALSSRRPGGTAESRLDGSGSFVTSAVSGGPYILRVSNSPAGWMFKSATYGGRDISIAPVELIHSIDNVVITFTDRWTGVQGIVQTAQGALDPEASVLLFPAEAAAWSGYGPNPRRLRLARAGRNGSYTITSVPPGEYYVVAIPERDTAEWQDPRRLEALSRDAERVTVVDGGKVAQNLRTRAVRW